MRSSIDAVCRAELPITHVIGGRRSIEAAYADMLFRRDVLKPALGPDALAIMKALLSTYARERAHAMMLACLRKPKHTRATSLERAAQRMLDVDLDAAWRAALRGDAQVLHDRLAPHVTAPPKRTPKGTPWRASGWLSRRATRR